MKTHLIWKKRKKMKWIMKRKTNTCLKKIKKIPIHQAQAVS